MRINGIEKKSVEVASQKAINSGQDVQLSLKVERNLDSVKYNDMGKSEISTKELARSIEKANEKVMNRNTELRFSVHEKTKQVMIKVMNKDTQEVIREIPSEKILDMVANFMEIAGLYVDEEV